MTLRSFILTISAFIMMAIMAVFYFQTQKILGGAFADLEKAQLDTVNHTTESLLETKKYSLQTYRNLQENNNSLSSVLLVASAHQRSGKIVDKLTELQKALKTDIVDFIPYGSTPIRYTEIPPQKGQATWEVGKIKGELALLSYSPVRHYGERIGTLVLGTFLNSGLAPEIQRTTRAKVQFSDTPIGSNAREVVVDASVTPPRMVNISIDNNFIEEMNRSTRSGITWLGVASFVLVLVLIYVLLEFGFVRSFTELLGSILSVASDLDKGIVSETRAVRHPIKEVDHLGVSFAKFSGSLKSFKERIEQQSRASAFAEVAEQVAHDLKSPLSALDMMLASENLVEIPENRRNRIHACIQRIKDTIRVLSERRRDATSGKTLPTSSLTPTTSEQMVAPKEKTQELISSIVENIVQEKRIQYRSLPQLQILFQATQKAHFTFVEVNSNDLKRALSNLIDNAAQAITGPGRVEVTVELSGAFIELFIKDSGRGIPANILPKLGQRGATFNKEGGTGLGLFGAKSVIENAQGRFEIRSSEGRGTEIHILLPVCTPPDWFLASLKLAQGGTIVVVDDDPSIHEMWTQKLLSYSGHLHLVHLMNGDELDRWLKSRPASETKRAFFLFDYDLAHDTRNGLEWIEKLGLGARSVLVTSYYEKKDVRQFAARLGVKLVPKGISGFVPIEIMHPSLVSNEPRRDA